MARLSETHSEFLSTLSGTRTRRYSANKTAEDFYTGEYITGTLNIAVPPELAAKLNVASDWPATVVDSYAERMRFLGWADQRQRGLGQVTELAGVPLATKEAVLDSLIFGIGFIALEPDDTGVWKAHSVPPTEGTLIWDNFNHRPVAGMRERTLLDGDKQTVLYLPEGVAYIRGNSTEVEDFVPHTLGVPSIVRIRNNVRSRRWYGRSMISAPVRYYTIAACRTLQGMELNREFYTYPQRWLKNGTMDMFVDGDNPSESEKVMAGFRATTGSLLTLPPPEMPGDPEMELHQFSSSPPTPFIEQVRAYSQLMSSATGIPVAYLGFSTENPPSADAIRAWLDRLILGCRNQQDLINPDLRQVGWMASWLNGNRVPWSDFSTNVKERWEDPSSPTLSSDADAIMKLSQWIDPTSDWALDRLRIPDDQRPKIRQDARAEKLNKLVESKIQAQANMSAEDAQLVEELSSRRGSGEP